MGMPSALASFDRATAQPSLLESTITDALQATGEKRVRRRRKIIAVGQGNHKG